MKNVLLLGATGTTGSALAQKLLYDTEYHVTLFSRHAKNFFESFPSKGHKGRCTGN